VTSADVLVIGGGVIGASVAYHILEREPRRRVILLEREAQPGTGATARATGGVRHQFSTATNVRLTLLSYPYFTEDRDRFGRSVDFIAHGYLFVTVSPDILGASARSVSLQQSLGVRSRLLAPAEMRSRVPQLKTDDLVGGSFCPDDGSADPHGLLHGFLGVARSRGLDVRTDEGVIGVDRSGKRVTGVRTARDAYSAPAVVNCAGPHADEVGRLAGIEIPSRPFKRQVMVTEPLPGFPETFPLVVDLDTGFYVHRQGAAAVLMGGTDKDRQPGHDTTVDWDALGAVLDAAARRVPALAEAKVMRAYAGVRDLTPDFHGVLDEALGLSGFYIACGFSGHGFMHAPAIGLLMAELILDGRARSLDVEPLSLDRFARGTMSPEANVF
jgi:sarcosine oxidase subunit beta